MVEEPSSEKEGIGMKEEKMKKEEIKEEVVKEKVRGRGRKKKEEGSTTTTTTTTATTPAVTIPIIPNRVLRRLDRHESLIQELSSNAKLLRSKRFMKKIDAIDALLREVKILDRRLRKIEKVIGIGKGKGKGKGKR